MAVLHDLNLTAAHADHVLLLQNGAVAASGQPDEVMTPERLSAVYDCDLRVLPLPPAA